MTTPPPEKRELQLLDSVEFKILNVATNEKKLTDLLQRYLTPIILKASSEHAAVRSKVIQLLGRLTTFIKPPEVVLPIDALLDQYKTNSSGVIKHLDLSYIQHTVERIDDDERRDLLPKVLAGCAADEGESRAGGMLCVILRILLDVRIPPRGSKDDQAFRETIGLGSKADADYLARMIGVFLRLRAPSPGQTWPQANPSLSSVELSLFPVDKLETDKVFTRMSELKAKLVVFLASGAFTDDEKFLPSLYAASSFDNRVASTAEEVLKRSSVSLEDEHMVKQLFHAHSILPAAYRTRILSLLAKSAASTKMHKEVVAVVDLDFMTSESAPSSSQALQPASRHERTKLHKSLFQYLAWVAQVGPTAQSTASKVETSAVTSGGGQGDAIDIDENRDRKKFSIGVELIDRMRSYIMSQDWPRPDQLTADEETLRSKAYETIGLITRSADLSDHGQVELASWLFRSLSEDPTAEAVVNIDGALSSLTASVAPKDNATRTMLKSILLTYMNMPEKPPALRSTRHAAVKWANQCLPFSDVYARWIDILGEGGRLDERSDVIEQSRRGLDPYTYFAHNEKAATMPEWSEMVVTFFGSRILADSLGSTEAQPNPPGVEGNAQLENFQGDQINALPVALEYCRDMLFLSAFKDFKVEPHWKQTLNARVNGDVADRKHLREFLRSVDNSYLVYYLRVCLQGAQHENQAVSERCLRCFTAIASLTPGGAIGFLVNQSPQLFKAIASNKKEIRSLASQALGILGPHPANGKGDIENIFAELSQMSQDAPKAIGPRLNAAEGALVALGHLASRCRYYKRELPEDIKFPTDYLVQESVPDSLFDAALQSCSQLWPALLAVPVGEGTDSTSSIIEKLSAKAKKGNEKAISALGLLAVGLNDNDPIADSGASPGGWDRGDVGKILKELFALHESKNIEIQFAIGNAISAAIARWDSSHVRLAVDVDSRSLNSLPAVSRERMSSILLKIIQDCKTTKPSLLKASGIWLFCVVQSCSHLDLVQARLREAQAAFMKLLSARDELVQETASRGLSLVYERGDEDLRGTLVKDLVAAFTGSGPQIKVDDDTELFEPGALPTGEGSSITSYKDIVSLANEVGDQRLVYKFMSLAANAATWSTRSAFGRFGLSNILSESEIDPKLYPKLYRYRFDPNKNVQRSMDEIWKALVKDSSAVLEEHFDTILEDLLKSILGREWRMREASCAAISELLQGRPFAQYEQYYREIWTKALKVIDDVKGSVRTAATHLCMALSNGLVRQLEDGNNLSMAKSMMKEALPFLLSEKGVESSTQDVQLFATITVLKIAKKGGDALKPFIPDMVPQLLGLLSTIEPEQINYHYQRAGEDSRDKIDKLRAQMVNQSPISEAIDNSLRFIDADVMEKLAPRLEATIKTAIGMPTKIGCSRVLTTLFTRHTDDIQPVSTRLLQLMEKQTLEKNDEVSQAYARAAAYILRVVSDDTKRRFCERFTKMYLQSEEEGRRQKISDVVVALAKISPDHFTSQEGILLPLSYLGSHDIDEYTGKVFGEVWNQHAGSQRTVVRYVPEIVGLVEQCLETTQWALRHGAAFTVAAMVSDVAGASDATGEISEANLKTMWPVFEKALALKTFSGKEKLLDSFPRFIEKGPALWNDNEQIASQMKKIMIREAKRNNDEYRVHAFKCLWQFAKARKDINMLGEIGDLVGPHLDELKDEDKMEIDSKEDQATNTARNGLEALGRGYSRLAMDQGPGDVVEEVMQKVEPYLSALPFKPLKREVWYGCVEELMKDAAESQGRIPSSSPKPRASVFQAYLRSLDLDAAESGVESQRLKRVAAASALIKAAKAGVFGDSVSLNKDNEATVRAALRDERGLEVQKAWRGVLELF